MLFFCNLLRDQAADLPKLKVTFDELLDRIAKMVPARPYSETLRRPYE